ncbi:hypothetical protein J2805_001352 [Arthrobacter oryzae]|nr:hypothetical protein [Arthrobacter oryzae]
MNLTWHEAMQEEFSIVADRIERVQRTFRGAGI